MSGFMLYSCAICNVVVADPPEVERALDPHTDRTYEKFFAHCPVCRRTTQMIYLNNNLQ